MKRIIYKTDTGGVAIVIPTPEYLETHSIEDLVTDLPAGVEFKIVDVSDIPSDRTFRDAWEFESNTLVETTEDVISEVVI